MNRSQDIPQRNNRKTIPLRESVEKTGWKESAGSSRPAPPQGQGRTPTSNQSSSQTRSRDSSHNNNR